ncbi:HAMP domain-containing histidine kinase [Aeromicrobium senzhongii]|uniref:histidine kinase n=1 Tax=Aeromicrobium senzhongii TaxID=2663859 RepID=A0ABX6SUG7_9ACTN|nr:HAMP domain-containing sensor histidine kinase [Aeromicrobium senzhongii]MTB89646.1 HAMP domain-containing protein [Aeromicrobium senzhongii]QNL94227.1 HAMP domain-containing histidine kinase [Aeromicrobium senzhongii]
MTVLEKIHARAHTLFEPITTRLSLAGRVALLTTAAVAAVLTIISISVFVLVRQEIIGALDDSMLKRANQAVEAGYTPRNLTVNEANLLAIAGIQLLTIRSGGGEFLVHSADAFPYDNREREVALGLVDHSARTAHVDGVTYRVVAVQAGPGQAFVLAQSMESTRRALERLRVVLTLSTLSGMILAGVAGWAVAGNGLRPVRRLTAATERVAATRDLTPIDVGGKEDELARLTRSFNAMLLALDDTQRRERQLIADAGHELRTPLTSLRTNVDLLRQASGQSDRRLDPAAHRELLDDIGAQLDELTTLVSDLTELARDEPLHRDPEPLDLAEVVQRAVDRVQLRASTVTFDVLLDSSWILGDSRLLERAVTNLLDNAVKWSPPGGTVRVRLSRGTVTVADEGPGIAAEDLPHVFDRFYRSTEARTLPGSGLGLAIVKRAADRHGGSVDVDSEFGHGATFTFRVPLDEE